MEKGEIAHLSNYTFFHNVFCAFFILKSFNSNISVVVCGFFEKSLKSHISIVVCSFFEKSFNSHISVVVCSFFEFGTVSKWCIREWVKSQASSIQSDLTSVNVLNLGKCKMHCRTRRAHALLTES